MLLRETFKVFCLPDLLLNNLMRNFYQNFDYISYINYNTDILQNNPLKYDYSALE